MHKRLLTRCSAGDLLALYLLAICVAAHAQFDSSSGVVNTNAVQALQVTALQADQAYDDGKYKRAFKLYQQLAKDAGDGFSQYRLGVMYYFGQHVEHDIVSAYAWSYLAAESGIAPYRKFNRQMATKLDDTEHTPANNLAKELIQKYGIFQQALKTRRLIRKEKFSCTGSRVGNTCSSVSVRTFNCSAGADRTPSEKCLRMGRMGLNAVAGSFPLKVKQAEQTLEALMDRYNPGNVNIGELELIDEDEKPHDREKD
jgi:hypothetical protein